MITHFRRAALLVAAAAAAGGCSPSVSAAPSPTSSETTAAAPALATASATSGSTTATASATAQSAPLAGATVAGVTLADTAVAALRETGSYRLVSQTPIEDVLQETSYDVDTRQGANAIRTVISRDDGTSVTVVGAAGRALAQSTSFGNSANAGKKWYPVTVKSPQAAVRAIAPGVTTMLQVADPSSTRRLLAGSRSYRRIGEETLAGTPTVRYTGSVSPASFAAVMPAMRGLVTSASPTDVWLDRKHHPRRIRSTVTVGTMKVQYTQTFSQFGTVTVSVPKS